MKEKGMIRRIIVVIIILLSVTTVYASSRIVGVEEGYDYLAEDIFERIFTLEERYPEIIEVIEYGRSVDDRPLYAIRMSADVNDFMEDPDHHIQRTHYYIDGGNHSRETVNPPLVLRMVEDYARDYYGEESITGFDLKKILNESVLHFIPLASPDGYNLVKIGLDGVQTKEGMDAILSVPDTNYSTFKANLRGVDLNRNYPSWVYDTENKIWVDLRVENPGRRSGPSSDLYAGPYGASEPEVKHKIDYILEYDFRQFITFHSRGEVTFWNKYYFPNDYNSEARKIAEIVNRVNGYRIGGLSMGGSSGYFSDFTAGMTFKPTVTIETTPAGTALPTIRSDYDPVYRKIRYLPLHIRELGEETGYHDYKLYRDDRYVRDFPLKDYAEAIASKFGGEVRVYSGQPKLTVEEEENPYDEYRIFGSNRYHTAHKIAVENDPDPDTVLIVRGESIDDIPQVVDGLTASGLAGVESAQILMVMKDRIPNATREAIEDLNPNKAIIIGGVEAVSKEVEVDLEAFGLTVERIQGENRFATAAEVSKRMGGAKDLTAIIVNGFSDVDSLVAGPLAHSGHPILLINNRQGIIPQETLDAIDVLNIEKLLIVGGTGVVSEEIKAMLKDLPGIIEVERLGGKNRFETSMMVGRHKAFSLKEAVSVVNGMNYIDAVAASTLGMPVVYYSENHGMTEELESFLQTKGSFKAIGGSLTISNGFMRELIAVYHYSE